MDFKNDLRRFSAALLRAALWTARGIGRVARATLLRTRTYFGGATWRRSQRRIVRVTSVLLLGGGLAMAVLAFTSTCIVHIQPGEIGVRQSEWGGDRGVEPKDHPGPAIFVSLPGSTMWHRIDGRTRVVTFGKPEDGGGPGPLEVRTREGNAARVSVSVPYRVRTGEAHEIVAAGTKLSYVHQVSTTLEKVLAQELARLSSDEFHDPDERRRICAEALVILNERLADHHVEVDDVLIRDVEFLPTYEKTRQDQQLAGQSKRTEDMLHALAEQQLDNQAAKQRVDEGRRDLLTRLTQQYDEAERAAKQAIERRRLENQALQQELAGEKAQLAAELAAEHERARYAEEVIALGELLRRRVALEEDLARAEQELTVELTAQFTAERRAEEEALAAIELERRLVDQALDAEAADLVAEWARTTEAVRAEGRAEALAVAREAERGARERLDGAELRYESLVAAGEQALEAAAVERERLRGEVLASGGGRVWLAREAASRLRFGRVVLDPRDGRVPSPLELDALGALLLGAIEPPPARPR